MHPPPSIDPQKIAEAVELLRAGRLVVFPTETVYGLGANGLNSDAVALIYAVKRRPPTSPLIVHVASPEMIESVVAEWPAAAQSLAQAFWPGPLTLVVKKNPRVPNNVTAGLGTVAVRMPAHPMAQALIRAAGIPVAAPSANRFTELSPTTAEHVRRSLGGEVDLILDGGPCQVGIESTVVSLVGSPTLLRPGSIYRAAIEAVIGPVQTAPEIAQGPHPSPGMHQRHYSPRTPLHLSKEGKVPDQGKGIYLQHRHRPMRAGIAVRQMPESATEYAAALYLVLHQSDAENYDWIVVDSPPDAADWEAVRDRLRRAASVSPRDLIEAKPLPSNL